MEVWCDQIMRKARGILKICEIKGEENYDEINY